MPRKSSEKTTEGITVSIKSDLLPIIDELAGILDLSRSSLVNVALKSFIKLKIDRLDPRFMSKLYQSLFDE